MLLQMELWIESAEIWYHNCTFSMNKKREYMKIWYIRQIWIHLVSYVHIHHRIESVHKIAIDSICSKIQFCLLSFASPTIIGREIQMVTLFSCLLFIMNLNRFFMYAQVSLIDGKFITIETIRYGSKRKVIKRMEKNSIILFFVNALSIFANYFPATIQRSKKFSFIENFFSSSLAFFVFFCRYINKANVSLYAKGHGKFSTCILSCTKQRSCWGRIIGCWFCGAFI